jgi:hypothetical protein
MVHKTMHNLLGDARGFIVDDKKGLRQGRICISFRRGLSGVEEQSPAHPAMLFLHGRVNRLPAAEFKRSRLFHGFPFDGYPLEPGYDPLCSSPA